MKTSRRQFIRHSALGAGALASMAAAVAPRVAHGKSYIVKPSTLKLGTVTYNLARDWDVPTLIKHCSAARFEGVELRTTHAHKVEVNLTADQRKAVRKQFEDSPVELMGLGSAFDYHTPDQDKLKRDIEATKAYIKLAHDVGAGGIKVRPNGLPKGVPKEKTLAQIGRSLRELGKYSESYGIQLRLEVHGGGTSLIPNIKAIMDVADHPLVGVCWNSNQTDLAGEGFDNNFNLVKDRINVVHLRDLSLDTYPFRKLFAGLNAMGFKGYCLAEIPGTSDPVRLMKYYRALFLAYQNLL